MHRVLFACPNKIAGYGAYGCGLDDRTFSSILEQEGDFSVLQYV